MSFLNPILAQAAAPEEVTVGTVIAATLFLITVVGSVAMIAAWAIRFGQTGHALPAARRGVLRVPWPLALGAIVLSVLFMALKLLESFIEVPDAQIEIPVANAQAAPAVDGKESSEPANAPSVDPAQVKENLILTIGMELMMLLAFGAVVLVASKAGRVYLTESVVQQQQPVRSDSMTGQPGRAMTAGMGFSSPWPDLDDASSTPQMPGYDILGNRGVDDPVRPHYGAIANADASPDLVVSSASGSLPETTTHDPFSVGLAEEPIGTGVNAVGAVAVEPQITDEAFSFSRELRFAAEVFLAAYFPTTALRLIIVWISMSIAGEPPDSHPFLEMLQSGVSVPMILMILIVAVFVAPIVEELQFRVVILGGIAQLGKPVLALIASSILFSFAHGFPDSIALIPLAFALGYAYLRRRSYVTVMLVHFLFNGFNMILALVALI